MEPQVPPTSSLTIDEQMQYYIMNTTKWAKFLAVVGFIISGFIAIMAFFIGTLMSTFSAMGGGMPVMGSSVFLTVFYLVLAVLYFIPCLFLYRFARRTRQALEAAERDQLLSGFDHLNRFFKFVGILTLIYLIIIALGVVAAIIGGMVGAAMA